MNIVDYDFQDTPANRVFALVLDFVSFYVNCMTEVKQDCRGRTICLIKPIFNDISMNEAVEQLRDSNSDVDFYLRCWLHDWDLNDKDSIILDEQKRNDLCGDSVIFNGELICNLGDAFKDYAYGNDQDNADLAANEMKQPLRAIMDCLISINNRGGEYDHFGDLSKPALNSCGQRRIIDDLHSLLDAAENVLR